MTAGHHGRQVGAPLGTYGPFAVDTEDLFILLGGHFTPFGSERLATLYPTHDVYVERVTQAAHRLVQRREILVADSNAYIREAAHSSIGT